MRQPCFLIGLLPVVGSSCLPDGIPPSQRQNLVNANGETYPVGFFICNWAASFAANILAATLVEEVLGYNTTLNADPGTVGSGTVAGYYGLTGCRTYNNATDRGCMSGATYYHVGLEVWFGGYPAEWALIQNSYSSMAPKDLGSMGYVGLSTMYIPKPVQNQAYFASGTALQYYRDWNSSWNQVSDYFGAISAIETSKLVPCNASGNNLANDLIMRTYLKITGDVDGVLVTGDDIHLARCDDGFFWAPPSCRAAQSQCVAWITGGSGWAVEEFMQKFTIFSMPVAMSVAASWSDYTTLPHSGDMAFYWWSPDPTFVEMSPLAVKFPPHQPRDFARGVRTSENSVNQISAVVSPDLVLLAPLVEEFADRLDLPKSHMDALLLDQKTSLDTWESVTCRWIRANRALWEKWIPDESKCFPGFGLYDAVLKDFTNARMNTTNKIVCQACPPGTFSKELEDSKGVTYVCVPCGPGSSQDSGASLSCKPCHAGEYQEEVGNMFCKRCALSTYQDESGQEACKVCPNTTNTLGLGSVAESDCGCRAGYIDIDPTGAFDCVKCGEGLSCPALSQLADLARDLASALGKRSAAILPGFYATRDAATEVFRCSDVATCPGGPAESCAGGLVGTPCSTCRAGETWTGTSCVECGGWRQVVWVVASAVILGFLILGYYLGTMKVTSKTVDVFATTACFGVLVLGMQNLGLIGQMTVEWPEGLGTLLVYCKFLLLDIDKLGFSCIAGQSESLRYFLTAIVCPVGVGWLALAYLVSRVFPSAYQWEGPRVCSTIGAFLQMGFGTMCATALAPMMCYMHPNGLRSVVKYPGVMCGSAEHGVMLAAGWVFLSVFVIGFTAFCTFAVWKVPRWSANGSKWLLATRFLVFRFRCDLWWFGPILLLRTALIQLPVVFATDFAPVQVVCIAMILTTSLVLQMVVWPWKVPLLNVADSAVTFCLVLVVMDASLCLKIIDGSMIAFANVVSVCTVAGIGGAIFVMALMTFLALLNRSALGGQQEIKFFNLGGTPPLVEIAQKVKDLANELDRMDLKELAAALEVLPIFDLQKITQCITLLAIEVAPPREEKPSFNLTKRIASSSFDPSLKRQSRVTRASRATAMMEAAAKRRSRLSMMEQEFAREHAPQGKEGKKNEPEDTDGEDLEYIVNAEVANELRRAPETKSAEHNSELL